MVVAARKLDIADLCVFIAAPPLDLNSQISNLKSSICLAALMKATACSPL
jgi:hypothetical protein